MWVNVLLTTSNFNPHSAASARIVDSSNPSFSPIPGTAVESAQIAESTSMKRRKRKDYISGLEDDIQKRLDKIFDQQQLETLRKCKR